MSYPKWKYHAAKEAVIVQSESEEKALGKDWADSPAEHKAEKYHEHMEKWDAKKEDSESKEKAPEQQAPKGKKAAPKSKEG